ncbi:MAG: RHS repeat protein, partial [Gammaproteobacteria bacterium]|nr:RHS repeat protein [Gammaproteobacteria bacterium]
MTGPASGSTATEVCDEIRSAYIDATPPVYFDSGTPTPPEVGDSCSGGGTLSSSFTAAIVGQNCSIIEVSSYCGQLDPPFERGPHLLNPICDPGYEPSYSDDGVCVSTADAVSDTPLGEDDMGPPGKCEDAGVGNPINPSNGNKYQVEYDYFSGAPGSLGLSRTYNSLASSVIDADMQEPDIAGVRWHHSLDMRAIVRSIQKTTSSGYVSDVFAVTLIRPDSSRLEFWIETDVFGEIQWTDILRGKHNRLETVEIISGTSLIYSRADGAVETYQFTHIDNDLTWMSISNIDYLNGSTASFSYNISDNLTSVTQTPGADYTLSYNVNGRISLIAVPGGNVSYAYDLDGNSQTVTYPDTSSRTYVYEDVLFPNALTGIFDENGARYSTYAYDSSERGILTKRAGDTNLYTFSYLGGYQTDVTDPFNQTITYEHKDVNGHARRSAVSSLSNTCSSTALSKEFDYTTGQLIEEKDAFGTSINSYSYSNDDKTVEVTNAEYVTITYDYLDAARLSKVTKDTTEIEFLYNVDNRLETETIRDLNTLDESTSTYTYDLDGRVASIDGPRTDLTDLTTYTYHASGDLASVTNAASQVTNYINYTADGRVGKVTEPSGLVTDLTYTPRGWLDTVTQLGLVTNYDYDAVGNLTRVTYPDSSVVDFVYDDAHRLTETIDHDGNRLIYTLDDMGNRTKTEIIDSGSTIVYSRSQTFDVLSRLKTIVGALNQTTEYEYDDNGNIIGKTDPLSVHTTYQLDSLNRVTTETND